MSEQTTEETPWKLPVSAAILGALMTAVYVIFTIVNAPTEDPDALESEARVESSGVPSGYVAANSDVGMRADVLRWDGEGATAFVSSVVRGGVDSSTTAPVEVARWELSSVAGDTSMVGQSVAAATPGAVTVEFNSVPGGGQGTLTATLPGTIEEVDDVLTMSAGFPTAVVDHRIAVGDHEVVIDELVIDKEGGWIRWHLDSGVAGRVDVVVSVDGVAFAVSSDGTDAEPPWNQRRMSQLRRVGGAPADSPFNITIELYLSVVTAPGESIDIPIGTVVGP